MLHKMLIALVIAATASIGQLHAEQAQKPSIISQVEQQLAGNTSNAGSVPVLLVAPVNTTLASPMFGRIEKHKVSLGSSFKKGDLLLSFVCDDKDAQVEMGEAEFASAQTNYENKLKLQGLSQAGEIEVTLAATDASRAKAQLDLFKAQADQCDIKAPFNGRVAKVLVSPYQGVAQGEPVLEILSADGLKAVMNIPATWLHKIQLGNQVSLLIDETGMRYSGKLSAINSKVDSVSHTIEVEAKVSNPPSELLPGMSGTAQFGQ
jgi:RND family efflux transporter MFP subunit